MSVDDRFNSLLTRFRWIVVGATLALAATVAALLIRDANQARQIEVLEGKAKKFEAYCSFVRISLETSKRVLAQVDQNRGSIDFRQHLANLFYSENPQLDLEAVIRCAVPEVSSSAMFQIRGRCKPPTMCILSEPGDPRCQVSPSCLSGVIADLLKLLAVR